MLDRSRYGWSGTGEGREVAPAPRKAPAPGAPISGGMAEEPILVSRETKRCPRCGQILFADMDVCYGCLFSFSRDGGSQEGVARADAGGGLPHLEEALIPTAVDAGDQLGATKALGPGEPRGELAPTGAGASVWIRTGDVDVCVPVPERGLRVGRAPANDIVLHSQAVSRTHAELSCDEQGLVVRNLGSTNPPLYQGRPIEDVAVVPFGETLLLCGTFFVPRRASAFGVCQK